MSEREIWYSAQTAGIAMEGVLSALTAKPIARSWLERIAARIAGSRPPGPEGQL